MIETPEGEFTVAAFVLGAALVLLMVWFERHPRPGLKPRLIPTTPLMFIGAVVAILALLHILTLLGIETGRR